MYALSQIEDNLLWHLLWCNKIPISNKVDSPEVKSWFCIRILSFKHMISLPVATHRGHEPIKVEKDKYSRFFYYVSVHLFWGKIEH